MPEAPMMPPPEAGLDIAGMAGGPPTGGEQPLAPPPGPPPGPEGGEPTLGDLVAMLSQLPPEVLKMLISELIRVMEEGPGGQEGAPPPPTGGPIGGPPEGAAPPVDALRQAAQARNGGP